MHLPLLLQCLAQRRRLISQLTTTLASAFNTAIDYVRLALLPRCLLSNCCCRRPDEGSEGENNANIRYEKQ